MQPTTVSEPVFLNLEYLFFLIYRVVARIGAFIFSINFLILLKIIATIVVILLIVAVIFLLVRLYELKKEDEEKERILNANKVSTYASLTPSSTTSVDTVSSPSPKQNETWRHVRELLLSDNQSEWRLAIIEADIYMDRTLDSKGFHGETVGDKLKAISPAQLASVQIAWEAHKVRNRIAHDGSAFTLTMPEARRVLSYYEIVFRDLGVID